MTREHVKEFYNELRNLQEEYGIYICADCSEDWDYDCNDEPICLGYDAYVGFVDEDGFAVGRVDYSGEIVYYTD